MEDFLLVFPLWMAYRIDPDDQTIEYACTVTTDGEPCVAVFTEELHAERFIAESVGYRDMSIMRVRDKLAFVDKLESQSNAYNSFSIDPRDSFDPKATTFSIREFLK